MARAEWLNEGRRVRRQEWFQHRQYTCQQGHNATGSGYSRQTWLLVKGSWTQYAVTKTKVPIQRVQSGGARDGTGDRAGDKSTVWVQQAHPEDRVRHRYTSDIAQAVSGFSQAWAEMVLMGRGAPSKTPQGH